MADQGFQHRKDTFLAKCDKSSAGEIDEKAREVCAELNRLEAFFTTSSCAGRAFIWRGDGVKSTECFSRFRVTHDLVDSSYFEVTTLDAAKPRSQLLLSLVRFCAWCQPGPAWQGRKHQRQERAEVAEKRLRDRSSTESLGHGKTEVMRCIGSVSSLSSFTSAAEIWMPRAP